MRKALIPDNEEERLKSLEKLEVLFSGPEGSLDRITEQLAKIFDVPAAMINIIGRDSQHIKASSGLPPEFKQIKVTREQAICSHVVGNNEMLVVEDLKNDARFEGSPFVEQGVRFYAGTPLRGEGGHAIGTLCFIDTKPRTITQREKDLIKLIADGVMSEIRLSKASRHLLDRARSMERDLASARTVQRFLLPPPRQEGNGYLVCHWYHPFDAIGGDFVDVQLRADGSAVVLLADVSGHGASAALTSAMTKTVFQRAAPTIDKPAELLNALHHDLGLVVESGRFMTAVVAIFDPESAGARISSAGHPYPVTIHNRHGTVIPTPNEPPLLVDADWAYSNELSVPMAPGDRLLLYTDGAVEAANPAGKMLEMEGLAKLASKAAHLPQDRFLMELFTEVRQFAHGDLKDDVALLCLERSAIPPVGG